MIIAADNAAATARLFLSSAAQAMAPVNHVQISPENGICLHIQGRNGASLPQGVQLSLSSCKHLAVVSSPLASGPQEENRISSTTCRKCSRLREDLDEKDFVIRELTSDRDQMKIKLTEMANENVEQEAKMLKYKSMLKKSHHVCRRDVANESKNADSKTEVTLVYPDMDLLKKRCQELEAINSHLSQHLDKLKRAFSDLQLSSSGDGSGSGSKSTTRVLTSTTLHETNELTTSSGKVTYEQLEQSSEFEKWYTS